jgi:hypothetical protein
MGPNVGDGEVVNSEGSVGCTVSSGTDDLVIVMENDLTTMGEWGDEKMIWELSI